MEAPGTGREPEVLPMPKTSVVVPVYNVKPYLEKCVSSILRQTETDFELLLVDDGSTDGCGALCDELSHRDGRVRVIHQENRGLGGARNTGLREARGTWILFPDSDDWLEEDILRKALEAGERENADMVVFGFRTVDGEGKELGCFVEALPKGSGLSPKEHKEMLLCYPCAWNKLYKRELFQRAGAEYPPRVWYEDLRTTPKLMVRADRVAFLEDVGYNYLQRAGSIMKNSTADRNVEILEAFDDLLPWFRGQGIFEEYRDELEYLALYHALLTASARVIRLDRKHPLLQKFWSYLQKEFPNWKGNPYLGRLSRNERLLLSLLKRRQYGLIALLFKLRG